MVERTVAVWKYWNVGILECWILANRVILLFHYSIVQLFHCSMSSICVDARLFDDRPPLIDFCLEMGAQGGGRGAAIGNRFRSQLSKALLNVGVMESRLQGFGERINDRLRRAFRRVEAMPDGYFKTGQSR